MQGPEEAAAAAGNAESGVAADAAQPLAENPAAALERKVAEMEASLSESRDLLLRRIADFDNTRKRLLRDKEESVKYANAALLTDLVDAMDGLERAIASTEISRDFDALHQGVVLIEKQLMGSLERKWGLVRMAARGQPFDPTLHQAVSLGVEAEGPAQIVLEELQSGYVLSGRVLRPARVVVSAPPSAGQGPAEGGADGA